MLISSSVNGRISNCIGKRQEARCDTGVCLLNTNMSMQIVVTAQALRQLKKISSLVDLTTYGALSCELAFLQSFAICFTLVDQSVERIRGEVVMPTVSQSIQGFFFFYLCD